MKILDSSIIPVMSLLSLAVASSVQAYPVIAQQEYTGANNVVAVSGTVGSPTDPTAFGVLIDGTGAISNNSVSNTGILFSGTSAYWISSIGSNVNAVIALDASSSGIANGNTIVNSGSLFGASFNGTGAGIGVGSSNFVNGNVIQNTGVISVSGYYTGMGIGITGQTINSNTLTNSGIISVASNANAYGFELYANNTSIGNNTILNSGTMSLSSLDNAYFASLYANGPISGNTITNLGDVTVGSLYSVAYGAYLYSNSYGISGNTISNQGTLNLISPYNSTYGVYIEGNADVTGNTITNSGTAILNGANYSSGVYLYSDNGAVRNNSISNLGTLSITSGGIDGVYLYGQSEVSGNTFLNSGNITLTATNGYGYGLELYSYEGRVAYNTLTNQGGLFVSSTNSSAYAISLQSYSDIVHNAITNTGTIQFDSYSTGYGVWLESYDGTISSNTITNQGVLSGTSNYTYSSIYGIGLYADNYGSVTGNTILNSGLLNLSAGEEVYPIYLYSSNGGISSNTITNTGSIVATGTSGYSYSNAYGVYLDASSDVTGNYISNLGSMQVTANYYGTGVEIDSGDAQISNNMITNKGTLSVTSLNGYVNGIYLDAGYYGAVSGNTISNSGVINLSAPSDIYSIYLYSSDGAVINNTITNSGSLVASSSNGSVYGIYAEADYYDPASNNTIINNGTIRLNAGSDAYAVYLYSSDGAVNNNVITNTGIIAASSTGGSVYGFQLYGDYTGSVSGNTITNTGLVQLSSQYDAYGAYLYSSSGDVSNNTIINQGTLSLVSSGSYGSSNVIGIYLQGDGNMLGNKVLNNGTLSVSGSSYFVEGVELYSSNANVNDSTLINSGKLLLSTAGNYAYGMWIDPEYTANNNVIANTGTLVLTGSSNYAYGISIEAYYADATNNTVTNTGNIIVNTTTGSAYGIGVVSDYGYGSGNKVVNFGNITVSGSDAYGIYVESGSNNSVVNWGTINANSGTGTAIAVVGDNNTITLVGHSTVSGTLVGTGNNNVLSLSFTGVSSKIKADLVSQLNSIGALSGTATSGTFTFRGQTYTYDPLIVQVNTSSYKDQGKTPNQKAVGASLDSFSINPTGQMLSLLNALDFSGNVASGLEQLSPQRYQVYGDIALSNAGLLTGLIDQRLANVRSGSESIDTSGLGVSYGSAQSKLGMGDSKQTVTIDKNGKTTMEPISDKRWSAFLSGVVSFVDIDGSNLQQDSKYTDAGVVGGVDVKLTDAWTAGLLGGYANSDVDLDSQGSSATVDSYSGGLYSGYRNEGFYGNGLAAYTRNNYDSVRKIDIPGYKRSADGSTSGSQYTFNIDGGYDHPVTKNVTVGPFAGLQYVHMGVDSFTETGAGAANLKLNAQNMDSLRSRLGVRLELRKELTASWTVASEVRAAWQHEFANNDRAIVSQFNGSGLGAFSVRTTSPERDRALVGVGINATYRDMLTTFVDYDAEVGSNYVGQILKGGLKLKF